MASILRSLAGLALSFVATAGLGCSASSDGGPEEGQTASDADTGDESSAPRIAVALTNAAFRQAQSLSADGPWAADTIQLAVSNVGLTCAAPFVPTGVPGACSDSLRWTLSVPVEKSQIVVGAKFQPSRTGFAQSHPLANGECSASSGALWEGDVEILAVDSDTVTFKVESHPGRGILHTDPPIDADGTYTSPRCDF